jgi:hypothetical protein
MAHSRRHSLASDTQSAHNTHPCGGSDGKVVGVGLTKVHVRDGAKLRARVCGCACAMAQCVLDDGAVQLAAQASSIKAAEVRTRTHTHTHTHTHTQTHTHTHARARDTRRAHLLCKHGRLVLLPVSPLCRLPQRARGELLRLQLQVAAGLVLHAAVLLLAVSVLSRCCAAAGGDGAIALLRCCWRCWCYRACAVRTGPARCCRRTSLAPTAQRACRVWRAARLPLLANGSASGMLLSLCAVPHRRKRAHAIHCCCCAGGAGCCLDAVVTSTSHARGGRART